ncbi:uncharacterized protein [Rutidosis leptorrhynchoides]|uniref:uncharacterized protein n=1 Tax=Rutidosis leptorrhynchoides TaxID=125765 RepID=UPI003A9A6208
MDLERSSHLKSATVSVLVNGSPTSEFSLERGIRQGDPLSPFLFIIAGEGLNLLAKATYEHMFFKGLNIGSEKILLSHLQFADDIGEWGGRNIRNVMKMLECFELMSSLKINLSKCTLFGIGVNRSETENCALSLGCKDGYLLFLYLGLPVGSRMNKLNDWKSIIDKFHTRLFQLETVKKALVCDRVCWSSTGTNFLWQWTRPLFGRSSTDCEMLERYLASASVDRGNTDKWKWLLSNNGVFETSIMATEIDSKLLHHSFLAKENARNKLVHKKIELFAWRTLRKRIPTWVQLDKKGIDLKSVRCPMCDDELEAVEHVLIFCKYAMDIWIRVFNWYLALKLAGLYNHHHLGVEVGWMVCVGGGYPKNPGSIPG